MDRSTSQQHNNNNNSSNNYYSPSANDEAQLLLRARCAELELRLAKQAELIADLKSSSSNNNNDHKQQQQQQQQHYYHHHDYHHHHHHRHRSRLYQGAWRSQRNHHCDARATAHVVQCAVARRAGLQRSYAELDQSLCYESKMK